MYFTYPKQNTNQSNIYTNRKQANNYKQLWSMFLSKAPNKPTITNNFGQCFWPKSPIQIFFVLFYGAKQKAEKAIWTITLLIWWAFLPFHSPSINPGEPKCSCWLTSDWECIFAHRWPSDCHPFFNGFPWVVHSLKSKDVLLSVIQP